MDGPFIEQTGGRIALMDGDFDVSEVESQSGQEMLDGEPQVLFTVQQRRQLPNGTPFFTALAVGRKKERVETVSINDAGDDASLTNEEQVTEQYGHIAVVPGEVAVYTTPFALGVFTHYSPVYETHPADIDLNEWMDDHDIFTTKAVGFKGRPKKGSKGTLYGSQLLDDEDFGSEVQRTILNELHVNYESSVGGMTDAYFSAGGFAEVYDGCESMREFLQWVIEDVKPHLIQQDDQAGSESKKEEDSEAERSGGDVEANEEPQETTLDDLDTVTETQTTASSETES